MEKKENGCPACVEQRIHTKEDWERYHPFRGHGYTQQSGWTHPKLAEEHDNAKAS
jgi:hypothetical protein